VIELLLQAERALSMGLVDQAERLYHQAADADPRNSIAVVGLARVALERGDDVLAWREAQRALTIDPENAAAQRMVDRFEEVWRHSGHAIPSATDPRASSAVAQSRVAAPHRRADTYGWPEADLRPDTETEPEDSAGRAADDGFPVAGDQARDAARPDGGHGTGAKWPPAEHEPPHPSTLPGLDRVRHLFTRKRE
jgi:Tetratricopeptide repeat